MSSSFLLCPPGKGSLTSLCFAAADDF